MADGWENDSAHQAVGQWLVAWRRDHEGVLLPSLSFAAHLGREAVGMMGEDVPRTEMLRLFAASGYDGTCTCGLRPGDVIPEGVANG